VVITILLVPDNVSLQEYGKERVEVYYSVFDGQLFKDLQHLGYLSDSESKPDMCPIFCLGNDHSLDKANTAQ